MSGWTVALLTGGPAALWLLFRPRKRRMATPCSDGSHLGPQHWVQFISDTGEPVATWYPTKRDAERAARQYGGRYIGRIDTGLPRSPRRSGRR